MPGEGFGLGRPRALDRNAKVRIMHWARCLSRRTRGGQGAYGQLTAKALAVLEALLWGFHKHIEERASIPNAAGRGLCSPRRGDGSFRWRRDHEKAAEGAAAARAVDQETGRPSPVNRWITKLN
jgi:hypothetical protein